MVKCESLRINMFRITHTGKSVNFPVTLLTRELTKLEIVFNSEKEQLKLFSRYFYYYYCFIYHYHYYYYLTLISRVNFLHLEDEDLFSFIHLFF